MNIDAYIVEDVVHQDWYMDFLPVTALTKKYCGQRFSTMEEAEVAVRSLCVAHLCDKYMVIVNGQKTRVEVDIHSGLDPF